MHARTINVMAVVTIMVSVALLIKMYARAARESKRSSRMTICALTLLMDEGLSYT